MRDSQFKQKRSQLQLYKKTKYGKPALGETNYEVFLQNKSRVLLESSALRNTQP